MSGLLRWPGRSKGSKEARLQRAGHGWRAVWSDEKSQQFSVGFQARNEAEARTMLQRVRLAILGYSPWPEEVAANAAGALFCVWAWVALSRAKDGQGGGNGRR